MAVKKIVLTTVILASFAVAQSAYADLSALTLRFGGGCSVDNTSTCTLKVTGTGTSLSGTAVQLRHASSSTGTFTLVSSRTHTLDSSGKTSYRVSNQAGCWKVTTANNGDDVADVSSNKKCE